jgi:hypothetical protein
VTSSGLNWLTVAGAGMKAVWASLQLLVFYLAGERGSIKTFQDKKHCLSAELSGRIRLVLTLF